MKTVFLMILVSAGTAFSATTDVCVIDRVMNNTVPVSNYKIEGYTSQCIQNNSTFFKTPNEQVVAKCSDRSDNVSITFNQIQWTQDSLPTGAYCPNGTTYHKVNITAVTSEAQARADLISQLYQKGYVLFDNNTMLRTR